jgi:hypothetical protein
MFDRKGIIQVEAARVDEDELLGVALDSGRRRHAARGRRLRDHGDAQDLEEVRRSLEGRGVPIQSAEVTYVPQSTIRLEGKDAQQVLRLVEGWKSSTTCSTSTRTSTSPTRCWRRRERLRGMDEASIPLGPAGAAPRAVGFDPGLADTGYAALEGGRRVPTVLGTGVIRTSARDPARGPARGALSTGPAASSSGSRPIS